jgi:hypothetical protein
MRLKVKETLDRVCKITKEYGKLRKRSEMALELVWRIGRMCENLGLKWVDWRGWVAGQREAAIGMPYLH